MGYDRAWSAIGSMTCWVTPLMRNSSELNRHFLIIHFFLEICFIMDKRACLKCKEPWCNEKWHTAQWDVIQDIGKRHRHPSLALRALHVCGHYEGEQRTKRRKENEFTLNEGAGQITESTAINLLSSCCKKDHQKNILAFEDSSEGEYMEMQGRCILPGDTQSKVYCVYCIGFSLDENNETALLALKDVNDLGEARFFLFFCPVKFLPNHIQ